MEGKEENEVVESCGCVDGMRGNSSEGNRGGAKGCTFQEKAILLLFHGQTLGFST